MLVLTRRVGQIIPIAEVPGNQVKIGIKAPRDVSVDRLSPGAAFF